MKEAMKTPITPIALTSPCLAPADLQCMADAVRGGKIIEGEITREWERQFSAYLGGSGGVATDSCTSALILAMAALDVKPGDEVVLPSYTCVAVLNAVMQIGAAPRLTDIAYDPARMDYNMTADGVRKALSPRTRCIVVPHMFGVPAAVDEIASLGVPVVEDITLSLGALCKGKPIGTWGDLAVCSFHASKMIACGEGGMLTANSHALYEKARYLNGWSADQAALRTSEDALEPYQLRYSFRLSDAAAALGIAQLKRLPAFVARRRELAKRYNAAFASIPGLTLPTVGCDNNAFFRYLAAGERVDVVETIRNFTAAGIEVGRGVFPPLHRYLQLNAAEFQGAERAVRTLLSIPLYPNLTDAQVDYILATSQKILSKTNA
jgi:perosamine synthetase